MAITYVGVSTAGDSNGSGLTGVTRPSTTTDDVLIADLYYESGTTPETGAIAFSNGTWTKVHHQTQTGTTPDFTHVRYISKYAGEGSTFNITWNANIGSTWRTLVVTAHRGQDTSTPQDATATIQAGGSSDSTAIAPGLTTVTNGAWLIYGEADFDGRTAASYTSPLTERSDFGNLAVASGEQTTAGASGNKQATLSGASWWTAGLIALRPAGGAGPKAPPPRRRPMRVWNRRVAA